MLKRVFAADGRRITRFLLFCRHRSDAGDYNVFDVRNFVFAVVFYPFADYCRDAVEVVTYHISFGFFVDTEPFKYRFKDMMIKSEKFLV